MFQGDEALLIISLLYCRFQCVKSIEIITNLLAVPNFKETWKLVICQHTSTVPCNFILTVLWSPLTRYITIRLHIRCHLHGRCVSFNLWRTVFLFSRSIIFLELKVCINVQEHLHFLGLMSIKRMNVNGKEFAHISARMVTSQPCQSGEVCAGWQVICLHLPPLPPSPPFAVSYYTFPEGRSTVHGRHFFANRLPRDTLGLSRDAVAKTSLGNFKLWGN